MADAQNMINHKPWVRKQYRRPKQLDARIQLHKRFSTNQYPWQKWVFDRLQLAPGQSVLEVGGGPGGLWDENRARVPATTQITFTDQSLGMVVTAYVALRDLPQVRVFAQADVEVLPFATAAFDVVMANHMLYHVPDRERALREIRRVLRPTGRFFAATNDTFHMQELRDLVQEFMLGSAKGVSNEAAPQEPVCEPGGSAPQQQQSHYAAFPFDMATHEFSAHFGQVQLHRYPNTLRVTDADALADYMLSGIPFVNLPLVMKMPFRHWLHERIEAQGAITVTTAAGLFEMTTAPTLGPTLT